MSVHIVDLVAVNCSKCICKSCIKWIHIQLLAHGSMRRKVSAIHLITFISMATKLVDYIRCGHQHKTWMVFMQQHFHELLWRARDAIGTIGSFRFPYEHWILCKRAAYYKRKPTANTPDNQIEFSNDVYLSHTMDKPEVHAEGNLARIKMSHRINVTGLCTPYYMHCM